MSDGEGRFVTDTAHRGITLSGTPSMPAISSTPQTNVHEVACMTQTTQFKGYVITVAADAG